MNQSNILVSDKPTESFIIKIILPIDKCPKVKNRFINSEGKAEVYITKKTTQKDALEGHNVYALSGYQGLIVPNYANSHTKNEIENYLNNRFGNDWEVRLEKVNIKNITI